jgi:hypothetical protein
MTNEEIQSIRQQFKYDPTTLKTGTASPVSDTDTRLAKFRGEEVVPKENTRGIAGEILPVGGAILGGIGGGIVGGVAGAAAGGIGAVPGAYLGAVGGSAAGGALGETAQQTIEKVQGRRENLDAGDIAKTGAISAGMEAVGGPLANVAGKVISGAGKAIFKSSIPLSAREAQLVQAYKADVPLLERLKTGLFSGESKTAPRTTADTALSKNLMGTEEMIGVQGKRAATTLWKDLISPQLKAAEGKINMPKFFKEAEQKIKAENPELSRQSDLLTGLKALKDDYKGVKDVTLEQLQSFKEGWAKFVPEKAYKGKPIAGAFNDVKDVLSGMSRDKIYTALGPEVKQAYFDYGNLKAIQEIGQKAMTGGKMKGGFGSFWSAIKDMALTPVATVGGNVIYKTGNGIQFIGKPGGRAIRDLFIGVPDIGKDITNPDAE